MADDMSCLALYGVLLCNFIHEFLDQLFFCEVTTDHIENNACRDGCVLSVGSQ